MKQSSILNPAEQAIQQEDPEQVPKHRRALFQGRALVSLGLLLLLLFGGVTSIVYFLDPLSFDVPVEQAVQRVQVEPWRWLMIAVSAPGFVPWNFVVPIAIIAGVALAKRFVEAAFLGLATVATGASDLMKALVHRGRPTPDLVQVIGDPTSYSFPSGHVTEYTLVFGFSFYLTFTLLKRGALRTLILTLCGGLVLLVGLSRVWEGNHWPSDALGGYALGFGLLLLVIWAYRGWEKRRVQRGVEQGQG